MKTIYPISLLIIFSVTANAQVKLQKQEDGLLLTENDEKVLFYQVQPKNLDGKFERCNYIHPLWGMDGNVLTEDFPADHFHHRGVFWAWHQIWIGSQRIGDGWEIRDFEQKVNDVEYFLQKDGSAILKTGVVWQSEKWKKQGRKVPYLQENTTIIVHQKKGNTRKIDFEIRLIALEENLSIGGSEDVKGYSGFSIRTFLPDNILFTGSNGVVEPQNEAVASPGYINISGAFGKNNSAAGVVIADHKTNPGYPQPWILRKKSSMQNAAFPGNTTIPVSTTDPLILNYSLIVYSGKLNNSKIQKLIR